MPNVNRASSIAGALSCCLTLVLAAPVAQAVDYQGTVEFQGQVTFAAPIAGISEQDLEVGVRMETEATGNGEKCSILSVATDNPDVTGAYPDVGTVSVELLLERGGPQIPDGDCIVTVTATGTDGVTVSARGSSTVFVPADDINLQSTLTADITVRESKAIAALDKECFKWTKKQLIKRAKCNFLLLKKGPDAATKCKDAGFPEPANCDPGDFIEEILRLSHDGNDQQTDAMNAEGVDFALLKDQVTCQKRFGRSAAVFAKKRLSLVSRKCVDTGLDSETCRDDQSKAAKKKLEQVSKCVGDPMNDPGNGRVVPQAAAPCDACIDGGGGLDTKCMRSCFQLAIDELTDGIIGDIPVCGNGIVQGGEFCDDGNTTPGDCCSDTCTVEAGDPEGPNGDPTCSDLQDNDCDTLVDGADPDCL
jgi:cysteine-rich repeat protein